MSGNCILGNNQHSYVIGVRKLRTKSLVLEFAQPAALLSLLNLIIKSHSDYVIWTSAGYQLNNILNEHGTCPLSQ